MLFEKTLSQIALQAVPQRKRQICTCCTPQDGSLGHECSDLFGHGLMLCLFLHGCLAGQTGGQPIAAVSHSSSLAVPRVQFYWHAGPKYILSYKLAASDHPFPPWTHLFPAEVTFCMIVASHLGLDCKAPPASYFETPCFVKLWLEGA